MRIVRLLRVHTLFLPVLIFLSYTFFSQHSVKQPAGFFLLFAQLFFQIISNLWNTYGDYVDGIDGKFKRKREHSIVKGQFSVEDVLKIMMVFILLGLALSIYLLWTEGNLKAVLLFVFSFLGIFSYTRFFKISFSRMALGEILAFIIFGPVSFFFYDVLSDGNLLNSSYWLYSGGIASLLMFCNNARDIESDLLANKKTLAQFFNKRGSQIVIYLVTAVMIVWSIWVQSFYLLGWMFVLWFLLSWTPFLRYRFDRQLKMVGMMAWLQCLLFLFVI